MEERDATDQLEIEEPVTDPEIELVVQEPPESPEEPGNPDAWLQWALIIGLLVLFLVCTILILVAWKDR